jgi:hypothetical protein
MGVSGRRLLRRVLAVATLLWAAFGLFLALWIVLPVLSWGIFLPILSWAISLLATEFSLLLAAYAGLVPAAHDSGKRVGNRRRMRGGNKALKRIFYQSAFASLRGCAQSRAFYERKRAEGKRHTQAVVALARRRVNVVWAMLRDGSEFEERSAA